MRLAGPKKDAKSTKLRRAINGDWNLVDSEPVPVFRPTPTHNEHRLSVCHHFNYPDLPLVDH